jgi:hypothetical protein
MMDKKQDILKRMQFELDYANKCNVEPVAGESYMTVQYVYHKLKESFESTFIPDHILEILDEQGFPLGDYYDYYIDQGYLRKDVDWSQITREYVMYKECEFVEEQLHEKVQAEYKAFMTKVVDMTPLKMGKLLTEIALKMQTFSIFRYQDCFSMDDMKLLQEVDNLLDRMYVKHDGTVIPADDEHALWAKTMEYLGEVVEDERGLEGALEDVLEA